VTSPRITPEIRDRLMEIGPAFAAAFKRSGAGEPTTDDEMTRKSKSEPLDSNGSGGMGEQLARQPRNRHWPTTKEAALIASLSALVGLLNTEDVHRPYGTLIDRVFHGTVSLIGISYTSFLSCAAIFFGICWWREITPR
jgi:hypothetical protein